MGQEKAKGNIPGSGLEAKAQQTPVDLVNTKTGDQEQNLSPQDPQPAQPNENNSDEQQISLLTGELEKLRKMASQKDEQLQEVTQKMTEIEKKAKEEALSKLPEIERYKATLQEQQQQINDLIQKNQEQQKMFKEQDWQIQKDRMIRDSGVPVEWQGYIHGNTIEEVQRQIVDLKGKLKGFEKDTLQKVPPAMRQDQIGNPNTGPVQNEGIPNQQLPPTQQSFLPMNQQYNRKRVEAVREHIKDVKDLEDVIKSDPGLLAAYHSR